MKAFANYYVDFLWSMLKNIGAFFASIGKAIGKFFGTDIAGYFKLIGAHVGKFNAFDWILFIIISLVTVVLIAFLVYRLCQLIRRYFIFRAKDVQKDKLMEEIAKLKLQADELAKEKGQVFAMKMGAEVQQLLHEEKLKEEEKKAEEGAAGGEASSKEEAPQVRFPVLADVDKFYQENPCNIYMTEEDMIPLSDIVTKFIAFSSSQLSLYYEEDTVRLVFAAMAASKLVILEGLRGSGKSSLPLALGKFFNNEALVLSVTPDWRDHADLIGYYDEFTKKYQETAFLQHVYGASHRQDSCFVILDEMNLARTEYYFSDFLALMDVPDASEWKIHLVPTASSNDPMHIVYGKMYIPQNIWYIGTANSDDSTFAISDYVYDRAVVIEINEVADEFEEPYTEPMNCTYSYLESLFDRARLENAISPSNYSKIEELVSFLGEKFQVAIGARIMKQITQFVPVYVACGGTEVGGIDYIVYTKLLRKLVGLNIAHISKDLSELIKFLNNKFGNGSMYYSIEYIKALQKVS